MRFRHTKAIERILAMKKRLKVIQGGSSAGKTIAILLILIDRAQSEKGKVFSVVSESLPHLKKGAMRDFLAIMEGHGYFKEESWNRSDNIYTFESGTKMEFFGAESADKVRGPRRDVLFENECNNLDYETHTQLAIRTNEDIYLDYNPVGEFWVHQEIIPNHEHDFLILTYKDNDGLPETIVKELESRKNKKSWWRVYGEGQLGDLEGKIYSGWEIIDEVPHGARLMRRGLDFGYSQDPCAIVAIYEWEGGYILDEELYEKFYSNKKIADHILQQQEQCLVIADSSEPKSIDEIRGYGVNVIGANKGPGSVNQGIKFVQDQKIWITRRSVNGIREYRNYLWKTDKDGRILDVPEDGQEDHYMDAERYGFNGKIGFEGPSVGQSRPTAARYGQRPRAR